MTERTYRTLYEAVGSGQLFYVDKYINYKKKQNQRLDIDEGNSHDWTPLMRASYRGWEPIVRRLINQYPRPNADLQNDGGSTALIWAAWRGYDSIIGLLFKIGANVDIPNRNNQTALLTAAKRGNWGTVQTLLNNGASVDISNNDDEAPLQFAIRTRNRRNVWRILRADRYRRVLTQRDSLGRTPLHIAAETGDLNIINLLLVEGADKTALDHWSRTPDRTAAGRGYLQAAIVIATAP